MLDKLREAEDYLRKNFDSITWGSLFIDYEKPHVYRLWTQWGENRIYLHKIMPCEAEDAFWHPHPWASAVKIISGSYEMGVGLYHTTTFKMSAKLILGPNTTYEMTEQDGYHYVRPLEPVYSIMVTGPKWYEHKDQKVELRKLSELEYNVLVNFFKHYYRYGITLAN